VKVILFSLLIVCSTLVRAEDIAVTFDKDLELGAKAIYTKVYESDDHTEYCGLKHSAKEYSRVISKDSKFMLSPAQQIKWPPVTREDIELNWFISKIQMLLVPGADEPITQIEPIPKEITDGKSLVAYWKKESELSCDGNAECLADIEKWQKEDKTDYVKIKMRSVATGASLDLLCVNYKGPVSLDRILAVFMEKKIIKPIFF
jgi:hypothetical protein